MSHFSLGLCVNIVNCKECTLSFWTWTWSKKCQLSTHALALRHSHAHTHLMVLFYSEYTSLFAYFILIIGSDPPPGTTYCVAANPPEFFKIIRKSELEYKFPNDEFCFRIMKIHFFSFFLSFFLVFRRRHSWVCPPAAINIHTLSLILCYSVCAAGYNSLPLPVHVCHFFQLQGARPPPKPSPTD